MAEQAAEIAEYMTRSPEGVAWHVDVRQPRGADARELEEAFNTFLSAVIEETETSLSDVDGVQTMHIVASNDEQAALVAPALAAYREVEKREALRQNAVKMLGSYIPPLVPPIARHGVGVVMARVFDGGMLVPVSDDQGREFATIEEALDANATASLSFIDQKFHVLFEGQPFDDFVVVEPEVRRHYQEDVAQRFATKAKLTTDTFPETVLALSKERIAQEEFEIDPIRAWTLDIPQQKAFEGGMSLLFTVWKDGAAGASYVIEQAEEVENTLADVRKTLQPPGLGLN